MSRWELQQRFRYTYDGPVSWLQQRLVVVPPERHGGQRCERFELRVNGGEAKLEWSRDSFANVVARAHVPAVLDSVEFELNALVEHPAHAPIVLPRSALDDPRYVNATTLTAADNAISELSREIFGRAKSRELAAEAICAAVHDAMPYEKGRTGVHTTAAEAFALGRGVCQDHAHVMLAMCRSAGLPARYVSGHLVGEGATHAWVEVLFPDPVVSEHAVALAFDPCHGKRPDRDYVTVAVGRDYADVAPTSGTYHGPFAGRLVSSNRLVPLEAN
jgi:transglutaminase-like putative cysteine protease